LEPISPNAKQISLPLQEFKLYFVDNQITRIVATALHQGPVGPKAFYLLLGGTLPSPDAMAAAERHSDPEEEIEASMRSIRLREEKVVFRNADLGDSKSLIKNV
jgi:hypothetical protein